MKYQIHPAAEIFPLMTDEEFSGLVEDIREHGLIEPIVLYEGMVLDGRNRLRACEKLGIEARFEDWPNSEPPEAYVVSKNLHRRHLNESQRAMIAGRIANRPHGDQGDVGIPNSPTLQEAAEMLNIHRSTVSEAKVVLKEGTPEEIAAVDSGEVAASTTAKKIRQRTQTEGAGGRVRCPKGMTLEGLARQGLEHEEGGASVEDIVRNFHVNTNSYRMMRDIVLLSDRDDLSEEDADVVAQALKDMNATQRVTMPHQTVRHIVERIWGTKGHRKDKTIARRSEDFERAFGHVIQVGMDADKIEIPHIDEDRAKRAIRDLNKALRNMRALRTKLEELYS